MSQHIETRLDQGVLTVTIDRPEKKNALTADMYSAMGDAIARADSDSDVRVVLFTGAGGVFTGGNDLADFLDQPPHGPEAPVNRFIAGLVDTEAPLVAAVDGFAVGIGTTMLLHFDQVFATENARFSLPFVNLALVPEAASSMLLVEACGYQKAAELLMLGEPFSTDTALECGIVGHVSHPESLLRDATEMARKLAGKPRSALRATKKLMRRPHEPLADRILAEGDQFSERLASPAAREIMAAFIEKRAPDRSLLD